MRACIQFLNDRVDSIVQMVNSDMMFQLFRSMPSPQTVFSFVFVGPRFHTKGTGVRSGGNGLSPAIVAAVLRAEVCCKRSLALAGKLSAELEGAKMLAACEQVRKGTHPFVFQYMREEQMSTMKMQYPLPR